MVRARVRVLARANRRYRLLSCTQSAAAAEGAAAVVAKLSNAAHSSGAALEQPAAETRGAVDMAASCSSCSGYSSSGRRAAEQRL